MYSKYLNLIVQDMIIDHCSFPSAIDTPNPNSNSKIDTSSFPTDAILKQQARLNDMKEKGLAPKKRVKEVEHGKDDCGDDISGLGKDVKALTIDIPDNTEEPTTIKFITVPLFISNFQNEPINVLNLTSTL